MYFAHIYTHVLFNSSTIRVIVRWLSNWLLKVLRLYALNHLVILLNITPPPLPKKTLLEIWIWGVASWGYRNFSPWWALQFQPEQFIWIPYRLGVRSFEKFNKNAHSSHLGRSREYTWNFEHLWVQPGYPYWQESQLIASYFGITVQ